MARANTLTRRRRQRQSEGTENSECFANAEDDATEKRARQDGFPRRRRRAKPAISSLPERRRWVFNGDAAARRKHVGGHETLTPLDCVEERIKPNHKSVEVLAISDH